ncbi:non-ribosomal peptide synthetase [Micromonospora sp. RTGN7]|uniref:non-ribosomal peptide synthetase n=1 Tax=Micromonospora sp. RTGN7 TaxID=3016526 RepID=UPI0029FF1757|nr:non-ribosomal peptide synthetase [Micromonospora sp. RTGN7]
MQSTPNSAAVLDPASGELLSYARLWQVSGELATHLTELGVSRGDVVALSLPRGCPLVVAMLAVVRAGAAYLSVDPSAPPERVRETLDAAAVTVVVAERDEPWLGTARRVDPSAVPPAPPTAPPAPNNVGTDDPVYVMFTSGSTGTPKGVVVPHRAVCRLVVEPLFCTVEPGHRVANTSNPAFDAHTFETWGALAAGGCVVPLPAVTDLPLDEWTALLTELSVDALFLTTSLFHIIARERPAALRTVGTVLVGGEQLDLVAVRRVLAAAPPGRLVNGYGPTETTTFATYFDCTEASLAGRERIPVGVPLQRTTLWILEPGLAEVADGAVGELCIGGPGVALGYLGRPDLTAERFVTHPGTGERLYRSGDLARRLPDGAFEVLGRRDRQVKIRGFRIELDEIELAATATGLVGAAFVEKVGEGPQALLAAAVVPVADRVDVAELARRLAARLPEYMLPARWLPLAELPLGSTGKVDRGAIAALLAEADPTPGGAAQAGPETDDVTAALRAIWRDVLGSEPTDTRNFLEMGGNSIMAVQLAGRVRERIGVRAEPHDVLLAESFGELADQLRLARGRPD